MVRVIVVVVLTLLGRRGQAKSTARALNDFFALIPRMRKRREFVSNTRELQDREVMRKDLLLSPGHVFTVLRSSFLSYTSQHGSKVQRSVGLSIVSLARSDRPCRCLSLLSSCSHSKEETV